MITVHGRTWTDGFGGTVNRAAIAQVKKAVKIPVIGNGDVTTPADIDRMKTDAQSHEEEDKRKKQAIEARNKLDGLAYGLEKTLEDNKDKSPAEVLGDVQTTLVEA